MNLELYKQQGVDLFKRFEIAIPQKKTEPVLQVGNEVNYKKIVSTHDSKYIICSAYSQTALIHIREVPSAKCILEHRFDAFLDEMSDLTIDGIAIIQLQGGQNFVVKFPEGDILHAFTGVIYDLKLCPDKRSFLFRVDDDYFLYKSSDDILRFARNGKKIREVHISNCNTYALICYEYDIDIFSLKKGETLYSIHEDYKIFDSSISSDSRYFIYSARSSGDNGFLKTFELLTGKQINQSYTVLYDPEFEPFSKGWVYGSRKINIYYPDVRLTKELNSGYLTKAIVETTQNIYLLLLDSYRDKDYVDWNRFAVYNIDKLYDSSGDLEPVKRVEYVARFSKMLVSPNKQFVAVCYPSKAIEIYNTDGFKTLTKIEIENDGGVNMEFSSCSSYFILSYRNQLMIYSTNDFSLINKPLTAINHYHYCKADGLIALTDSLNAIQIRRFDDGSLVHTIPSEKNSSDVFALSRDKAWVRRYNGNFYIPEVIDLQSKERKIINAEVYNLKRVDGSYAICNMGILNTQTEDIMPIAGVSCNSDNTYYSFSKYSVKVSSFAIEVFENTTGLMIKRIVPSSSKKFGSTIAVCGDFIIYEVFSVNGIIVESISNSCKPILLVDHSIRKIERIDDSHFFITDYRVNTNITDVYIFSALQLEKPIWELALDGNLYTSTCDASNQRIALSDSKICWYIDLKNHDCTFSIKEENNLGSLLFDNILVKASGNNKLQYYNTSVNEVFKPGDLLATLYTIPDGFLWTIPPDAASPYGWFWTDRPEFIEVMQYIDKKHDYELLSHSSPERQKYIELHNRKDIVMSRIHSLDEYVSTINNLLSKKQLMQIQQFKHTLMLNS